MAREPHPEDAHHEAFDVSNGRVKEYIRQLEQLYNGGSWQGEDFTSKLKDVDEIVAFTAPVPGVHSIGEILWHCIHWRKVLFTRLQGREVDRKEIDRENFKSIEELKLITWPSLKAMFEENQYNLIQFLSDKMDSFLDREYQPGYSFGYCLEGIVQHDVYHLGQIGIIEKMIRMKKSV